MQPEPRVGRLSIISVAVAAVLIFGTVSARATTYYVSQSGNDSWTGTSDSEPWQTLTKASTITYGAGDQILLKCGDTWNEELHPLGSGTPSSPIVIGSYGAGDKPIIDRLDYNQDRVGVRLDDQGGYKIAGLEFNRCMTGIYAEYSDGCPTKESLQIEDCYFHDSLNYGHYEEYPDPRNIGLGVCLFSYEKDNRIVLNDITIKNCTFRRLASGVWTNSPGWTAGPSGTASPTISAGITMPGTAWPGQCSSAARIGSLKTANGVLSAEDLAAGMARRSTLRATATT